MRRPSTVEVMLLTTIVLWSLNLTVSRYILTHGFQPLAYATVRYGLAVAVFIALTLLLERSLRIRRRDLGLVAGAALLVYLNQIGFVYALERSSASVLGLILGATPIFAALAGVALRTETLPPRFWAGAVLSFVGVALVAVGPGARSRATPAASLLGLVTAATWAGLLDAVTPLMSRYSARRISAVVLGARMGGDRADVRAAGSEPGLEPRLGGVGAPRCSRRSGRCVLTNELWFRSLDRIGPARATLAANLQPFLAAALAVVLLSETLDADRDRRAACSSAPGILVARRAPPGRRRAALRVAFPIVSPLRRTALASVAAAVALIAIKLVTGLAAGSLAFVAEAAHSGTDLVAALLTLYAVGVATKPADDAAPLRPRQGGAPRRARRGRVPHPRLASSSPGLAVARIAGWIELEVEPAWWAFAAAFVVIAIDVSRASVSYRAARRYSSAALALERDPLRRRPARHRGRPRRARRRRGRGSRKATRSPRSSWRCSSSPPAVRLIRRNVDVLMDRAPADAVDAAREAIERLDPPVVVRRLRLRQAGGRPSQTS